MSHANNGNLGAVCIVCTRNAQIQVKVKLTDCRYLGVLGHGNAISYISAVFAHEYHLYLIYKSLVLVHVTMDHKFCNGHEAASSQVATDHFPEQKTIINGSKK